MASNDVELLTEHFGYPPVSLLDDIINSINILAERALNSVETGLLNAPPASLGFRPPTHVPSSSRENNNPQNLPIAEDAHRHEIESGTHQLETLLCASIDRNFDKFELYVMRNILCVRPDDVRDWIRLSHYDGLDFSHQQQTDQPDETTTTEGDSNKPSVESINRLRRRLQASQKLNVMLHAEKARNELLLEEVRKLVGTIGSPRSPVIIKTEPQEASASQPSGDSTTTTTTKEANPPPPLAFLHRNKGILSTTSGAESPITTTTDFTLSQLQALRSLSGSLRGLMPDLASVSSPPRDGDEDEDEQRQAGENGSRATSVGSGQGKTKPSWRRERLEYVETATRKHLENVRGLELGRNGEVRDGEWQGEGRKLGEGEVDGLEGLVNLLGAGTGGSGSGSGGRGERIASSRSGSVARDDNDGGGDNDDDGDKMDET